MFARALILFVFFFFTKRPKKSPLFKITSILKVIGRHQAHAHIRNFGAREFDFGFRYNCELSVINCDCSETFCFNIKLKNALIH